MLAASITRLRTVLSPLCRLFCSATPPPAAPLPDGGEVEKVDFERHIMGLFGRMRLYVRLLPRLVPGQGRLPPVAVRLRPDKDYAALTRDSLGRRVNAVDPDDSLLLLKATGQVAARRRHALRQGRPGSTTSSASGSPTGAPWTPGSGDGRDARRHARRASPSRRPAKPSQLQGRRPRSPTAPRRTSPPFCDFRTNDDAVADVSHARRGHGAAGPATRPSSSPTAATSLPVRVLVPAEPPPGFRLPEGARGQLHRPRGLRQAAAAEHGPVATCPATPSSSAASPSTPSAACRRRTRSARSSPTSRPGQAGEEDRRAAGPPAARRPVGDQVLRHHRQQHRRAGAARRSCRPKRSQMWHDWFRKRVADNMPYDQIVQGVLTRHQPRRAGRPRTWIEQVEDDRRAAEQGLRRPPTPTGKTLDLFWRRQQQVPLEQWGEKTAAAFLGVRLECAQCHKHPFDRWTQADYRAYANVFGQVTFGNQFSSPDGEEGRRRGERRAQRRPPTAQQQPDHPGPRGVRRPTARPDAAAPRRRTGRCTPKALGGPEITRRAGRGPARDARSTGCARRTTRSSPAASSTASGATTSASASSTRSTTSRSPTRRPTTSCSTPWPRTSSSSKFDIRHLERTILLVADLPAVVDAERDQQARQEQLRPQLRPAADGRGGGRRAERGPGRRRELRHRRPGRAPRPIEVGAEPAAATRTWPTPSASSAGRRGPRPATASGPWSRPCRRRCS